MEDDRAEVRERILSATLKLISTGGTEAATTRAVAAAAKVQAPTIYRLFGDKQGLLDAAAAWSVTHYVADKSTRKGSADPLEDLRHGWDRHVAFGLANPGVFQVMRSSQSGAMSSALAAGQQVLRDKVRRLAIAGRLRVPEERAVALLHSTGVGVIETLLAQPEDQRDPELSSLAREAVLTTIASRHVPPSRTGLHGAANALRASLHEVSVLSEGERALLGEWLERIAKQRIDG